MPTVATSLGPLRAKIYGVGSFLVLREFRIKTVNISGILALIITWSVIITLILSCFVEVEFQNAGSLFSGKTKFTQNAQDFRSLGEQNENYKNNAVRKHFRGGSPSEAEPSL